MAKSRTSRGRTRKTRARAATGRNRSKTRRRASGSARKARARSSRRTRPTAKKRRQPKRPAAARRAARPSRRPARAPAAASKKAAAAAASRPPRLERDRRRLPDAERLDAAKDLSGDRMVAAARSGQRGMKAELERHNETSPTLTAGDVDAKWEDAYAVGDESPGGDNPTPDQDRVDDIGKALGVQYQDNEELKGGDEIVERDQKRWELDPASSDDWPHKE